ncbi:ATP-binding protein [Croceivirga thetidis]|uniref:histidine kinase n=1 Tax=Croceivirga thetidis TaxID=2721623 RepID=A0ABX1GUQ7_9FLAO|nr:HAMP domain-containing histidine kinase [Croceivirga thetidis]
MDSLYIQFRNQYRKFPDSALVLGNKMLTISSQIDYKIGIAKAKESIARASMFKKSDSLSFELANEAFEYSKQVGADTILLETINVLGFGNYRIKRIDKVYEYNSLGRKYAKAFKNWDKLYVFTANAASLMVDLDEFEKAIEFFEECIQLLNRNPDDYKYAEVFIEISEAYYKKGILDQSEKYLSAATTHLTRIENKALNIKKDILQASLLIAGEEFIGSRKLLQKTAKILEGSSNNIDRINLNLALANLEFNTDNFEEAKKYADDALIFSRKTNYFDGQQSSLRLLSEINNRIGQHELSNVLIKEFIELKDSINFSENENKLRIALIENDFQNEQELLSLKIEKSKDNQRSIIIISTLIILFLTSGIYLIKKNANALKILNKKIADRQLELEEKTIKLDAANKTKDRLFSIMGHDFKGPVGNIQTLFNQYIAEGISKEQFQEVLPSVKTKIDHILFALNNLLSWGSAEMDGAVLNKVSVNLFEKVTNAIAFLDYMATAKQIRVRCEIAKDIKVYADEYHVEIILRNLLSNAIKFSSSGSSVNINSEELDERVETCIQDSGHGIPRSIQNKVFQENGYISTLGTNKEKGTGLGLKICKDLVTQNNGEIWIESTSMAGTKIIFSLPKFKT